MGGDKDSLITKAKVGHKSKAKQRNSLNTSHWQADVQPSPGKQDSTTYNGMEYLLGQLGSAVSPVVPPNTLCTPSLLTGGGVWRKALTPQVLFSDS